MPKNEAKKQAPESKRDIAEPAVQKDDDVIRDRDWYTINPGTGKRTKVKRK
jgi:hypothetical protein